MLDSADFHIVAKVIMIQLQESMELAKNLNRFRCERKTVAPAGFHGRTEGAECMQS